MTIYSEPGRGTTCKVYLPLLGEEQEDEAPAGTETILLVEDEAPVRALAREILESAGYQALEGPTPEEAMAIASGTTRRGSSVPVGRSQTIRSPPLMSIAAPVM